MEHLSLVYLTIILGIGHQKIQSELSCLLALLFSVLGLICRGPTPEPWVPEPSGFCEGSVSTSISIDHRKTSFSEWWVAQNEALWPSSDHYNSTLVQWNMGQIHLSVGSRIPPLPKPLLPVTKYTACQEKRWALAWGALAEAGQGDRI